MKWHLPLALLLLGLALPAAHAVEEAGEDASALDRPLPPIAAPTGGTPPDDATLDSPPPPPPPIDLDYRAPAAATPAR